MTLGEQIKALRKQKGYTQEQLGELVGAHINTVVRWENETRIPNAKALMKLAEALGVNVGALMGEGEIRLPLQVNQVKSAGPQTKKEPPRLTYWAEVVEEARAVVKRGDRDEIIDVMTLLERAFNAVEDAYLAMGANGKAKASPIDVGEERPQSEHGDAV